MPLSSYRGSTQDATGGVVVAQSINEDGSASGALVAGVQVGNKTLYGAVSRVGITGADAPTGGDITVANFAATGLCWLGNALNVKIRATSTLGNTNLVGRPIFYDSASGCLSTGPSLSFVSDATLRLGNAVGDFISPFQLVDVGSAQNCKFFVDSVSSGSWSVYLRPV